MDFTVRLQTLTAQHRLNPRRVSTTLGVPYSTVERWYKGEVFPRLDQAQQLAELFGVSLDELAGGEPALTAEELAVLDAARTIGLAEAKRRLLLVPAHPNGAAVLPARRDGSQSKSG